MKALLNQPLCLLTLFYATLCGFTDQAYGDDQRQLPDAFFLKCPASHPALHTQWLVRFDREAEVAQIKIPYLDDRFKICFENDEEILIKRDCENGMDELRFNKWDGSFNFSLPCQILDSDQQPLYR